MRGHWFVVPVGLAIAGSAEEYSRQLPGKRPKSAATF